MVEERLGSLPSSRRDLGSRSRRRRVWRVMGGVEEEGGDWEWRKLVEEEEVDEIGEEGPEFTLVNRLGTNRNIKVYCDEAGQLIVVDLIRKVSRVIFKTTRSDLPLVQLKVGLTRTTTTSQPVQVYLVGLVNCGQVNKLLRIWHLDLTSNLRRRKYQPPTRELHLDRFTSNHATFTHLVCLSGFVVVGTEDLGPDESSLSTGTPSNPEGIGVQRLHLLRLDRAGPPTPVTFFSFQKLTFHPHPPPRPPTPTKPTEPQYEWREHDLIELITTTLGWLVGLLRADNRIQLVAWDPDRLNTIAQRVTKEPTTIDYPPSHLSTPFPTSKFNLLTSLGTTLYVLQPHSTRTFQLTTSPHSHTSPHLLTPTIHPNSLPTTIIDTTTLVTSNSQPHLVTLTSSQSVSIYPLNPSSTIPTSPSSHFNPLDALFPLPLPSCWGGWYRNHLHLFSFRHSRSLSDALSPHPHLTTSPDPPNPSPPPLNPSPSPPPFPRALLHRLSQPPPNPTLTPDPVPSPPPSPSLDPVAPSLVHRVTRREIATLIHRIADLESKWSPTD